MNPYYSFLVTSVVVLGLVAFFKDNQSSGSSVYSSSVSWHTGGNLHSATVFQWGSASERNKLATCGDWIAAWEEAGLTLKSYPSIDSVKPDAMQLRECVNRSIDSARSDEKINEYGALCAVGLDIIQL